LPGKGGSIFQGDKCFHGSFPLYASDIVAGCVLAIGKGQDVQPAVLHVNAAISGHC
jgi:hypothetical protein